MIYIYLSFCSIIYPKCKTDKCFTSAIISIISQLHTILCCYLTSMPPDKQDKVSAIQLNIILMKVKDMVIHKHTKIHKFS